MELEPIHSSAIGLDVHQKHVTACLIAEEEDGSIHTETVTFGTFNRDRRTPMLLTLATNPEFSHFDRREKSWCGADSERFLASLEMTNRLKSTALCPEGARGTLDRIWHLLEKGLPVNSSN